MKTQIDETKWASNRVVHNQKQRSWQPACLESNIGAVRGDVAVGAGRDVSVDQLGAVRARPHLDWEAGSKA